MTFETAMVYDFRNAILTATGYPTDSFSGLGFWPNSAEFCKPPSLAPGSEV